MKGKKYLIFCNSFSKGGGERIAVNLANGLSLEEKDVCLFSIENKQTYESHESIYVYKNPVSCDLPIVGKLITNVSAFFFMIYIIKKYKIDVVVSHLFRANYINIFVSFITKHQSVVVTHGSISKYLNTKISSSINIFLIKRLYFFASKKVFLTGRMRDDYLPYVGENNNVVIPNCYDLNAIENYSNEAVVDCPYNKGDYFIFVGRFHSVKNIDSILDTFIENNSNLLLVGDGCEFDKFRYKYIDSRITFLGAKSNPYPYIKNAKCLLLASESEGFPNVLIEAFKLGVPVISSDCRTGPREILEFGDVIIERGSYI